MMSEKWEVMSWKLKVGSGKWETEAMAEGIDHIEPVAGLQCGEAAGAVAHNLDEQGHGTVLLIHVVHGDGASQHHLARALHQHLHELSRRHGLHLPAVLQHQREVAAAQLPTL